MQAKQHIIFLGSFSLKQPNIAKQLINQTKKKKKFHRKPFPPKQTKYIFHIHLKNLTNFSEFHPFNLYIFFLNLNPSICLPMPHFDPIKSSQVDKKSNI